MFILQRRSNYVSLLNIWTNVFAILSKIFSYKNNAWVGIQLLNNWHQSQEHQHDLTHYFFKSQNVLNLTKYFFM